MILFVLVHATLLSIKAYAFNYKDVNKHTLAAEWIVPGHSFPYGEPNANMSLLVYCDTIIISHIYSMWHWNLCYNNNDGPYTPD